MWDYLRDHPSRSSCSYYVTSRDMVELTSPRSESSAGWVDDTVLMLKSKPCATKSSQPFSRLYREYVLMAHSRMGSRLTHAWFNQAPKTREFAKTVELALRSTALNSLQSIKHLNMMSPTKVQ